MAKKRKLSACIGRLIVLFLLMIILVYNPVSVRLMTVGIAAWHDLDAGIFYRLIRTESGFRSFAISRASAIGLGQVREDTAFYINEKHRRGLLFLPFYNLNLSARYLNYLHGKYQGNWSLVLAAYNWGETKVSKRMQGRKIEPDKDYRQLFIGVPETYNYIEKILGPIKKA